MAEADAKRELMARYQDIQGTLDWYCVDHWTRELGLDIALLKEEVDHLISVHPDVTEFLDLLQRAGIAPGAGHQCAPEVTAAEDAPHAPA